MAQGTRAQEAVRVDSGKPTKASPPAHGIVSGAVSAEVVITHCDVPTSKGQDSQDDALWDCAVANSIDAIRGLAEKALADRQAGRTKKVTL